MDVSDEIFISVVANIITTLIYAVIVVVALLVLSRVNRRRVATFFDLDRRRPALSIYVSRFQIDAEPSLGYQGPAMLHMEYKGAEEIALALRASLIPGLPRSSREWLTRRAPTIRHARIAIDTCPPVANDAGKGALVAVGGGIHNPIAQMYLDDHESSFYRFELAESGEHVVRVLRGPRAGIFLPGRDADPSRELAIVQRLHDMSLRRTVVVCAGLGSSATYGAAHHVAANWRTLQRSWGDRDFGLVLAFIDQDPDVSSPENVVEPRLLDWYPDPTPGMRLRAGRRVGAPEPV